MYLSRLQSSLSNPSSLPEKHGELTVLPAFGTWGQACTGVRGNSVREKRNPCASGAAPNVLAIELKRYILQVWSFYSTTAEVQSDKLSPTPISVIHRSERSTCSSSKQMSKVHSDKLKERSSKRASLPWDGKVRNSTRPPERTFELGGKGDGQTTP